VEVLKKATLTIKIREGFDIRFINLNTLKMVQATRDDNLDSIIEKILSQESIKSKFSVYSMFYITHKHYIPGIDMLIQINDPELWKLIRKGFYYTILDKMKKYLGIK
jgi:hypothetical protein